MTIIKAIKELLQFIENLTTVNNGWRCLALWEDNWQPDPCFPINLYKHTYLIQSWSVCQHALVLYDINFSNTQCLIISELLFPMRHGWHLQAGIYTIAVSLCLFPFASQGASNVPVGITQLPHESTVDAESICGALDIQSSG